MTALPDVSVPGGAREEPLLAVSDRSGGVRLIALRGLPATPDGGDRPPLASLPRGAGTPRR